MFPAHGAGAIVRVAALALPGRAGVRAQVAMVSGAMASGVGPVGLGEAVTTKTYGHNGVAYSRGLLRRYLF